MEDAQARISEHLVRPHSTLHSLACAAGVILEAVNLS